jgi:hypothetical protein
MLKKGAVDIPKVVAGLLGPSPLSQSIAPRARGPWTYVNDIVINEPPSYDHVHVQGRLYQNAVIQEQV